MKHRQFDKIGVEVYKTGALIETRYFEELSQAIKFQREKNQNPLFVCKFITADEYGVKIEEL